MSGLVPRGVRAVVATERIGKNEHDPEMVLPQQIAANAHVRGNRESGPGAATHYQADCDRCQLGHIQ